MADYEDLDDATLQQRLSDATSYEERAALRQVLRKRKKDRGESNVRTKARGNSVYNRFAGSTAKSTKSGSAVAKLTDKPAKQEIRKESPRQFPSSKSPASPPVPTTPTASPDLQPPEPPQEEINDIPQTSDSATNNEEGVPEEKSPSEPDEVEAHVNPVPEDTTSQEQDEEDAPEDEVADRDDEVADGDEPETQEEIASTEEHNQSTPQDNTDSLEPSSGHADLQHYLVAYVNQELFLDPPIPARGKALYDTCSDSTSLCKLINKAVPGTVDLRALSKVSGSASQRAEARHDNMTLVIESARAIGCRITDDTHDGILRKDPETINQFLLDLVRAQVVHMPGMEDEPASTFSDMQSLFQKLHISVDSEQDQTPVSWRDDPEKIRKSSQRSTPDKGGSWRDAKSDSTKLTYEERAALRKAEREQRQKEKEAEVSVALTYEERAAQRKAERERRRREREALAK